MLCMCVTHQRKISEVLIFWLKTFVEQIKMSTGYFVIILMGDGGTGLV